MSEYNISVFILIMQSGLIEHDTKFHQKSATKSVISVDNLCATFTKTLKKPAYLRA